VERRRQATGGAESTDTDSAETDTNSPTVQIDFVDYSQQLGLGRVLAERPKNLSELLGRNHPVAVLVERRERLTKLYNAGTAIV